MALGIVKRDRAVWQSATQLGKGLLPTVDYRRYEFSALDRARKNSINQLTTTNATIDASAQGFSPSLCFPTIVLKSRMVKSDVVSCEPPIAKRSGAVVSCSHPLF